MSIAGQSCGGGRHRGVAFQEDRSLRIVCDGLLLVFLLEGAAVFLEKLNHASYVPLYLPYSCLLHCASYLGIYCN
jgi:hypothetical protein